MTDFNRWRTALVAAGGIALGAAWIGLREARRIQFRQIDLALRHLPDAFDGYKAAHLTDIHLDGTRAATERLCEAVAWINAQQPDLIALTGDFLTLKRPGDTGVLVDALRTLRAADGVYAVLGNHDHKRNYYAITSALKAAGVTLLLNAIQPIERGGERLHLCGVDSLSRRRARLDRVLRALPRGAAAILMAHEPDFADVSAITRRFDLQLSGHAHGGQIRIPLLTRLVLPVYGTRYSNGLYLVHRMVVYSNRGLGTTGLPLRFRCPPEVALIRLHPFTQ
ncbi:MAG: serine/threonine protein phosphatase [Phototrophicales bacterium]|nr:MAG: serine/threonine protein phosphatase [Phototrophicales bacterium]